MLGMIAQQVGRFADAGRLFEMSAAVTPAPAVLNNLGVAMAMSGALNPAVEAFRRALAAQPDYAEAHHNLANALRSTGRVDEAVVHFHRALALRPGPAGGRRAPARSRPRSEPTSAPRPRVARFSDALRRRLPRAGTRAISTRASATRAISFKSSALVP